MRETERRKVVVNVPALVSLSDDLITAAILNESEKFLEITTNVDRMFNNGEILFVRDYRTKTISHYDSHPFSLIRIVNARAKIVVTKGSAGDERIDLFDPFYSEKGIVLREIFFIPEEKRRERIIWFSGGTTANGFYAVALEDLSEAKRIREEKKFLIPLPA